MGKIARGDLVGFSVRFARLVVLAALPAFAACYTTEEVAPPPLHTTPASEKEKPSETQNATLPDAPPPGTTSPPSSACTRSGLTKGGGQAKTITVNGEPRTYVLSVPQGYGELPQSWRVVFAFHGGGGTGESLRNWYDTDRLAESQAIVVYPDARWGAWDLDSPAESNPDVALFDALLGSLRAQACVDDGRVFAVGFSNGAYFANQLACRRGDALRAIAPHAGGGPWGTGSSYDAQGHLVCPGKPPAVMVLHAEDDYTVPVSNVDTTLAHWTWANGCQSTTHGIAPNGCSAYDGCARPVEVCRYWGVGHSIWSEGAKATWDFFASF